jgi:hypothetical protein
MKSYAHKIIWLQPWCETCDACDDRAWCEDNVWEDGCECGAMPVKYEIARFQPAVGKKLHDINE